MSDEQEDGDDVRPDRESSWLERRVLPPSPGEHRLLRELKGLIRVGIVVIPILVLFEAGRTLDWW